MVAKSAALGGIGLVRAIANRHLKQFLPFLICRAGFDHRGSAMRRPFVWIAAGCLAAIISPPAEARSYPIGAFDGAWHLTFETRSGTCDAKYDFDVNILNGNISHPNLVKFHGRVSRSGAARASVAVQDKYASGAGRLEPTRGSGSWSGYSGAAKCSGTWTARKT